LYRCGNLTAEEQACYRSCLKVLEGINAAETLQHLFGGIRAG